MRDRLLEKVLIITSLLPLHFIVQGEWKVVLLRRYRGVHGWSSLEDVFGTVFSVVEVLGWLVAGMVLGENWSTVDNGNGTVEDDKDLFPG